MTFVSVFLHSSVIDCDPMRELHPGFNYLINVIVIAYVFLSSVRLFMFLHFHASKNEIPYTLCQWPTKTMRGSVKASLTHVSQEGANTINELGILTALGLMSA